MCPSSASALVVDEADALIASSNSTSLNMMPHKYDATLLFQIRFYCERPKVPSMLLFSINPRPEYSSAHPQRYYFPLIPGRSIRASILNVFL
jgi:hypothetical protein